MKKIVSLIVMVAVLACSNGMLTQAANVGISVTSLQGTSELSQDITNPYGMKMKLEYIFQYSDANSVILSGITYRYPSGTSSENMRTWYYKATPSREGDRLYVTVFWYTDSGVSFETKVWCDIYGDNGIVY